METIPGNLEECFAELDANLPKETKNEIKSLKSRDEMANYHFSLGTYLRNRWKLWFSSPLTEYINHRFGEMHPDDMSEMILDLYYDHLHGNDSEWKEIDKNGITDADIEDYERLVTEKMFRDLASMPIGTRTTTAELASAYGVDDSGETGISMWEIDSLLLELVRKDGRFILDDSHHAGLCEGLPYNLDFMLLRNNMRRYDEIADGFAVANGKYGAVFDGYSEGSAVYTEIVDKDREASCAIIVVDKDGYVRYMAEDEMVRHLEEQERMRDEDDHFPLGRSLYESMERKELIGTASEYEMGIVSACKDCGYDEPVNRNSLCRALEEAEFLEMVVAIVPDPDFQPGGRREGQCDGWSYHPEVVTKEKYDRMK